MLNSPKPNLNMISKQGAKISSFWHHTNLTKYMFRDIEMVRIIWGAPHPHALYIYTIFIWTSLIWHGDKKKCPSFDIHIGDSKVMLVQPILGVASLPPTCLWWINFWCGSQDQFMVFEGNSTLKLSKLNKNNLHNRSRL